MKKHIEKAKALTEALPYIIKNKDSIFVIKYGGSAMQDQELKKKILQDIVLFKQLGIYPVVVHGGGPEINKALEKAGKKPEFVNGLRVTDEKTMEIVEKALCDVNKEIATLIADTGARAARICGKDGNTLLAKKKLVDGKDLGLVGDVELVNVYLLNKIIREHSIPVIAPVGFDDMGNSYNINADYAAVAIAGALRAEKLIFLTDVPGVLKNADDPKSLVSELSVKQAEAYIKNKTVSGGMIPKIECCIAGIKAGVGSVYIIDGKLEHSLLMEAFTDKGFGTVIRE